MEDENISNSSEKRKKKFRIWFTRFSSQTAENFGWTIGGFTLAYDISGANGIIALFSSMLAMANFTTRRLRYSGNSLGPSLIRTALIWRGISFIMMILAYQSESLALLILGGGFSGVYVGSFWPAFYSIYEEDFKEWYSAEKTSAIILIILSAVCLNYLGVFFVLAISFIFVIVSYISTLIIDTRPFHTRSQKGMSESLQLRKFSRSLSPPERLAFFEGSLNSSTNLCRYLIILTGTVSIQRLPEYISLGLILAISQFLGAIFSWMFCSYLSDRGLIRVGLAICSFSTVLLMFESSWLFGIIILSCGSSVIFPVFKDEVDRQLADLSMGESCAREKSRNSGRLLAAIAGSISWLSNPTTVGSAIPVMLSLVALVYCWNNANRGI